MLRIPPAADDAAMSEAAELLRVFNAEYDDDCPDTGWLAARFAELVTAGDTVVYLWGEPAHGFGLVRLRPSYYEDALEAYLAELYVAPDRRGGGEGRALLRAIMADARARGAVYMDLTTTNVDRAAVALYESVGFDRHERSGPGVTSYYFEIDL